MTRAEFRAIVAPLALALRTELDAPTWGAYFRALKGVPVPLLQAAVDHAHRTPRQPYEPTFPTAPTLCGYAEAARVQLLQRHPYTGCVECEAAIGWRPRLDHPNTVERCPCHARHQQQLAELGVTKESLALPPAPDWTEAHAE